MTFISSEGKKVRTISIDGTITNLENKYYNNDFCLSTDVHVDSENKFKETFREDFVKIINFDNEDYLIVFPDSTKISFTRSTLTYLGIVNIILLKIVEHDYYIPVKIKFDEYRKRNMLLLGRRSEYANVGENAIEDRSCNGNVMSMLLGEGKSKNTFFVNKRNCTL
jgi:hypothetical protein